MYNLVSPSSDLTSATQFEIAADGTIDVPVPQGMEGKLTLYIVRPEDGSAAETSFIVDTKAPTLINVVQVRAPAGQSPAIAKSERGRSWFQLTGSDGGSGITQLQIAPRAGTTWRWRSLVVAFSAPIHRHTIRVRIADAAGNVSGWFLVPVTGQVTPRRTS
jgi:hypothetical protein